MDRAGGGFENLIPFHKFTFGAERGALYLGLNYNGPTGGRFIMAGPQEALKNPTC
jgi:hypothetical protein